METGRTVILLNLENLYESLYDVLNQVMICLNSICIYIIWPQYYTKLRENRYVDLGLQSHRIKCRVDDNFKYEFPLAYICIMVYTIKLQDDSDSRERDSVQGLSYTTDQ